MCLTLESHLGSWELKKLVGLDLSLMWTLELLEWNDRSQHCSHFSASLFSSTFPMAWLSLFKCRNCAGWMGLYLYKYIIHIHARCILCMYIYNQKLDPINFCGINSKRNVSLNVIETRVKFELKIICYICIASLSWTYFLLPSKLSSNYYGINDTI